MLPVGKEVRVENSLEVLTANATLLYMKAKNYHLNVAGPRFYGDHKTYDGIAEVALTWFDTLAERMRTLQEKVCVCTGWVEANALFDIEEDADEWTAEEMAQDMVATLQCISTYIQVSCDSLDDTTLNMVQEFDSELGRQLYFVQSSL